MNYPDDLPGILYYRVGCTVRVTLPRTPVATISSSGVTNANTICPQIPHGADAWQAANGPWQLMEELPAAWLPFLQRQRGTAMDCRPDHEKEEEVKARRKKAAKEAACQTSE